MIVQCESCQSRFRVSDDKVTDRGVRVRCTGCRAVFVVKKDGTQIHDVQQASTGETVMGMSPLLPAQSSTSSFGALASGSICACRESTHSPRAHRASIRKR